MVVFCLEVWLYCLGLTQDMILVKFGAFRVYFDCGFGLVGFGVCDVLQLLRVWLCFVLGFYILVFLDFLACGWCLNCVRWTFGGLMLALF